MALLDVDEVEADIAGQLGGRAIESAVARNGARLAGRVNHPVSVSGIDAATPQIAAAVQSGRVDAFAGEEVCGVDDLGASAQDLRRVTSP